MVQIVALTARDAADLVTWRYPPPLDTYNLTSVDPGFLLDHHNGYFALTDGDELIGYRCFGTEGRVPGWAYDDTALDTGGGLRPDLTGLGLGRSAITVGLEFARERYDPPAFRVTVAVFNERALRVVRSLGFDDVSTFQAPSKKHYVVLVRSEGGQTRLQTG